VALVLPGAGVEEKKIVHAPVRRALNAMRKETETLEEVRAVFDACRAHLDSFCDAQSFYTERALKGKELLDSIYLDIHYIAYCLLGSRVFGGGTDSRIEAENGDLKKNPNVHSQASLVSVVQAETGRRQNRLQTRKLKENRFAHTVPAGELDLPERQHILSQLGAPVVKTAEDIIIRSLKRSVKMTVVCVNDTAGERVFQATDLQQVGDTYSDGTLRLWRPPRRVRMVKEVLGGSSSESLLICSCPHVELDFLPCACLLAVTKGRFSTNDVSIRYFLSYSSGLMDSIVFDNTNMVHPVVVSPGGVRILKDFDLQHPLMDTASDIPDAPTGGTSPVEEPEKAGDSSYQT
jgi:hypothetical protein